jgi:hypothetical protein
MTEKTNQAPKETPHTPMEDVKKEAPKAKDPMQEAIIDMLI